MPRNRRILFKIGKSDLSEEIIIYTDGSVDNMPSGYSIIINKFPILELQIRRNPEFNPYRADSEVPEQSRIVGRHDRASWCRTPTSLLHLISPCALSMLYWGGS